jgi:hypothetical protein
LSTVDVATGWVECQGYGAKGKTEWAALSITSPKGCPFLCWVWTRTTAASSSTTTCTTIANVSRLPSPAPDPIRRTIAPRWSRRTGRWCVV